MKRFFLFFLLISQVSVAQDFSESWNGHFSYFDIQALDASEEKIYAAAENSVFLYDLNSQTVETLTTVNGLSGAQISALHYSEAEELLLIGYENGLIEIKKDNSENILSVIDILEKATIAPNNKAINQFYELNGRILIATNYGISEYDLENLEFGETYYIGNNGDQIPVPQLTVSQNRIYAATIGGGIRYISLDNQQPVDFNEWQVIGSPNSSWKNISSIGNNVYAVGLSNTLYWVSVGAQVLVASFSSEVKDLWSNEEFLVVTTADEVFVYNENAVLVNSLSSLPNIPLVLNTALYHNDTFYLGHANLGLLAVDATGAPQNLSPEGPLMNNIFNLAAAEDELWVVFGEYSGDYDPYPLNRRGLSHKIGSEWVHLPVEELYNAPELSHVSINPLQPSEVYVSSYAAGIIKLVDGVPQILYNETNGLDASEDSNNPNPVGNVRINGSAFDSQGNLWLVNAKVDEGLKVITPQGEVQGVDLTSVIADPSDDDGYGQLVIDDNDNIYFGTAKHGVIAYQSSTGELAQISGSNDNLPSDDIRSLAIDVDGTLWIGTDRGLRVLYNPASVFEQDVETSPIIILEGDIAQELLYEQFISDIEVDGSNNKWIATNTAGVFQVSSNGQETLHHFTKDNSPLPSNNITSIEIDHSSGLVYFGTVDGLVSFEGTATQARSNLDNVYAYPNPVRPDYEGDVIVDGLMQNSNVKITDIEGNLVYEEISQGGSIVWDTTAFGKHKVASGVYLILVTSEDQAETKVAKIMIIR